MKKIFTFLLAASAVLAAGNFQNIQAQSWSLTGNAGTIPPTNFLGTTDNKALIFRTNNIERMRINKDGTVGINGNTNSSYALNIHASSVLSGINITDPEANYILHSTKSGNGYGIYVTKTSIADSTATIYSLNSGKGQGVYGYSTSGYGVYGYTEKGGDLPDPVAISGVYGYNPAFGYGVGGYCFKGSGIYGYSAQWIGIFGDIGNSNYYAGYFNGDVYTVGSYLPSDQNLKQKIRDVSGAMNIINQLHPKLYQYRQDGNYKLMNLPQGLHYGLIAQDVEKVLPDLIKETRYKTKITEPSQPLDPKNLPVQNAKTGETIDFKALNYTEFIPIIIKGMQEQQQVIDKQQQQIKEQQQRIEKLEKLVENLSVNSNTTSSKSSSSSEISNAYLSQNTPNPFTADTKIQCTIPATARTAQVIVSSQNGKQLQSYNVTGGNSQITIHGSTLAAGSYLYSLVIDGKILDTKTMILTK